jgi:hypothetical protein
MNTVVCLPDALGLESTICTAHRAYPAVGLDVPARRNDTTSASRVP